MMNREALDRWCERGILGLVLAIMVFGPLATGAVRTLELLIIQGLTTLAICLWVLRLWLAPQHRLLWPPICWAVILFVAYAIMRYLQADIEFVARKELNKILIYGFLFFIVLNNLHRQEATQMIALVMIFLAMGISLYAVFQFITDSDHVWHFIKPATYAKRATGTYICPNHLAGFLEMILPLGLAFTLAGRFGHATKVFLGYAALVILAGIGVTISRGGWLATGFTLLVFFGVLIRHRDTRKQAIACLFVLLVAGGALAFKAERARERFHERFQEMLVNGKVENIRFRLWQPAFEIFKDNVWLGAGPAHFDFRFRQYRTDDLQVRSDRVHNDYLNTLTDWGVVGFALVGSAWALLAWGMARSWKFVQRAPNDFAAKKSNKFAFFIGAGCGLLAILLHSFVDFNMHIPANAILAVALMAMLSGHWRFATERFWFTPGVPIKLLVTAACLAGVSWVVVQGKRRADEYLVLDPIDHFEEYAPERLEPLKQAFAIEPMNFQTAHEIGEILRRQSWEANDGYRDVAKEAMTWFDRSIKLNPYDSYSHLRYGMCLDWLDRFDEAGPHFQRAIQLDPNGYYAVAHMGWHLTNKGDYAEAKQWFERSLKLKPTENPIAEKYLEIVKRRLAEAAPAK
ncbi:MAG: O-antigen ligase family protein [Verrucomicrobia bacterium]|nr:O-antigen ligase family protein [Verrucomicrobiota bacterium]